MALTDNEIRVLDIVVKGGLGALLAAMVAYYGNRLQDERAKVQEENRGLQATIELTSRQKDLDVEMGMRLFEALTKYYFEKDTSAPRSEVVHHQLLLLRLIALNLQDVPIHLKPLFEDLDSQLTTAEEKQALREIAQEVARRQVYRLTVEAGYDSGPKEVRAGDELCIPELLTTVKIESVDEDFVRATIYSEVIGNHSVGPFKVTPFSMPLVDNTKLGENRVALVLNNSTPEKAQVRFVAFPKHLAADHFDIKEASRTFRDAREATKRP